MPLCLCSFVPLCLCIVKILLHICCGNCALYPFRILKSEGHDFTGFWFNPNIHPLEEYTKRLDSLKGLTDSWRIDLLPVSDYRPEDYFRMLEFKNFSSPPFNKEGNLLIPPSPDRCESCYRLRLEQTAAQAHEGGFDAFTTTLTISPYQDFDKINLISKQLSEKYNVLFYGKDFRPYFRDAMALSRELGLYRQKYCGCIFSKEERTRKKAARKKGLKTQNNA